MEAGGRKKYSWVLRWPKVYCYEDPEAAQTISSLWGTMELTEFHDAALARGTAEINAILKGVEDSNQDSSRKLSFIRFQNRLLLVWATYESIGSDDDEETVIKALKLTVDTK